MRWVGASGPGGAAEGNVKIQITRTGGFSGIEEEIASADSASLPRATQDELGAIVARLSDASARGAEAPGADRFQYHVDVYEPGVAPRRLTIVDEGDPERPAARDLAALLALVGARH